ncbi:hypothetical protein HCU40_07580 [Pseudanabaena biceps]|nr:hypothetical protein [Pseudanabaena biceps]
MNAEIDKAKAATESLLTSSTIDDPTETRSLLRDLEVNLPIAVRFNVHGLRSLYEQNSRMKNKDGIFHVDEIVYTGDMGGIMFAIRHELESEDEEEYEDEDKEFGIEVISITHLKVDSTHPLAARIKQYQKKRVLAIAIANSGTRRSAAKQKRKRRGFGS